MAHQRGDLGRLPGPKGPAPIELAGRFENGLQAWIHVLSFTERDALATHFVAKAEDPGAYPGLSRPFQVGASGGRIS